MKTLFAAIAILFGCASLTNASVTINFAQPIAGYIPSNLANAAGTITNGMQWGIIVDTAGNNFANSGLSYDAFGANVAVAGVLSANGALTDDYYVPGTFTVNASVLTENGGTVAGSGSIAEPISGISFSNGISAGDAFALVWFSTNSGVAGAKYGYFRDASFVIPADGSDSYFDAPFAGNDPTRSASNTFAAVAGIPEPSRVLLLGFGALGLMVRRRRSVA